jgi:hypothetical protein
MPTITMPARSPTMGAGTLARRSGALRALALAGRAAI